MNFDDNCGYVSHFQSSLHEIHKYNICMGKDAFMISIDFYICNLPWEPATGFLLTLCTQSLYSTSPLHLSNAAVDNTRTKLWALRMLLRRLLSNFPASSFSTSMNTVKLRSCRWTFSRLEKKKEFLRLTEDLRFWRYISCHINAPTCTTSMCTWFYGDGHWTQVVPASGRETARFLHYSQQSCKF